MADARRQEYGKLVRDRIPEIISANGAVAITRTLDSTEFMAAALNKVVEEAEELRAAVPEQRLDELADIWEVMSALLGASGLSWEEVTSRAEEKRTERGGFEQGIFLEAVDTPG